MTTITQWYVYFPIHNRRRRTGGEQACRDAKATVVFTRCLVAGTILPAEGEEWVSEKTVVCKT
ncbi:MAG: hypothetical protein NTAFB01_36790 [Nitrospira sp.]